MPVALFEHCRAREDVRRGGFAGAAAAGKTGRGLALTPAIPCERVAPQPEEEEELIKVHVAHDVRLGCTTWMRDLLQRRVRRANAAGECVCSMAALYASPSRALLSHLSHRLSHCVLALSRTCAICFVFSEPALASACFLRLRLCAALGYPILSGSGVYLLFPERALVYSSTRTSHDSGLAAAATGSGSRSSSSAHHRDARPLSSLTLSGRRDPRSKCIVGHGDLTGTALSVFAKPATFGNQQFPTQLSVIPEICKGQPERVPDDKPSCRGPMAIPRQLEPAASSRSNSRKQHIA
ncbi:hypothetical protein BV25DRAFT_1728267 [Artomyces pyxidatus]|uniref:Uncharacterized protein n=1 Tax=Artomyces pyxidatus TaxID=48021 RepID=A0ACB8SHR6_9AGAM|nr:hypothetical protein BV25DRAFT_1728267 [Artomyces pyxidatus]